MATPNVGILTNLGKNLIDQVNAGQTKITFSKIVFSSMDNSQLTDDQVKALTAITPQEVVVDSPEVTLDNNTGETRIRATGNNEALTDGVYVKTYAVYAKDDSGNEILYGITVSPNPNYLPEYDGVTPQAVTYSYKVNISNTSNITFTNSDDVYVSDTDLTEALQPYAKTVDVNQQLDKKVNTADMRKPAREVAGIDEVNAKQDKIGYTPADDSKVVHSADTSNWQKNKVTNDDGTPFINLTSSNQDLSATLMSLGQGFHTVYVNSAVVNNPFNGMSPAKGVIDIQANATGSNPFGEGFLIGKKTNQGILMYHVWLDGSKANYTQIANDSKVAHLSGANNFDTVPTVNNNPLLLASSLPSDLARTGQDTNFTGKLQKSGQDVALANNTIARNPNTGSVSETNTFTAQQTFSIAPVINDASTDKGDNQAATMADLKSVEKSAWHTVTLPDSQGLKNITMIYKIHDDEKYIEANIYAQSVVTNIFGCIMLDLSGIVHSITDIDLAFTSIIGNAFLYDNPSGTAEARAVGAKISLPSNCEVYGQPTSIGTISEKGGSFAKIYYDSLVNN
ncbi:hypothetical protein [Lentilactobacillus buchneri]|uniref:hypothetical protein n=1 Tax=Lentilactobacillus buchneri TaxID=1581 RepID=UPI0021A3B620|nr:hypothetical protein [Lentilactobacillus buchneri]MCT3552088.1 hypothetical protein [Lentilactobacillus buchneri]